MPTPKPNETKDEFIKRYMGSAEANRDYPDKSQRFAIANSVWKSKKIKI